MSETAGMIEPMSLAVWRDGFSAIRRPGLPLLSAGGAHLRVCRIFASRRAGVTGFGSKSKNSQNLAFRNDRLRPVLTGLFNQIEKKVSIDNHSG
jgi:hypothetical protein